MVFLSDFISDSNDLLASPEVVIKSLADKINDTGFDAALCLLLSSSDFNKIKTELNEIFRVLPVNKIKWIANACDYIFDIDTNKKITNESFPVSFVSDFNDSMLLNFCDVSPLHDVVLSDDIDASVELIEFETEVSEMTDNYNNLINEIVNDAVSLSLTKIKYLEGGDIANELLKFGESQTQNTPYSVGIVFAGEPDKLKNIKKVFGL
jgi:hypothetical protein